MGGKSSKSEGPVKMKITFDQKLAMPGESVSGLVECTFTEGFQPTGILSVQLIGKEKVMWQGTDSLNSDPKYPRKIVLRKPLVEFKQVIHTFDDKIKLEGIQRFAFSFDLPINVPSSFFYLGKDFADFRISYKIKALMEPNESLTKVDKKLKRKLKAKKYFVVGQYPDKIAFNQELEHISQPKNLVTKDDEIKTTAHIEKDSYQPDECIILKSKMEGTASNDDIWELTFSLVREVTSVSAKGIEYKDKTAQIKRTLKGFQVGQDNQMHEVRFPLNPQQIDEKFIQNFRWEKSYILDDLKDWYTAFQPSIKTHLFECKYYIEIKYTTTKGFLKKKIAPFIIPVKMYYSNKQAPQNLDLFLSQSEDYHQRLRFFNEQRQSIINNNPMNQLKDQLFSKKTQYDECNIQNGQTVDPQEIYN